MGPICIAAAGVGVLLDVHHNTQVEYAALFLVAMGTFSGMPVVIFWSTLYLHGHRRRSIGTAWQIGFGTQRQSSRPFPKLVTLHTIILAIVF